MKTKTLHKLLIASFAIFLPSIAESACLNLEATPAFETINGKRYVIIGKDDTVEFTVSPTYTLTSQTWTFQNGSPGSTSSALPITITYGETAEGKENVVEFTGENPLRDVEDIAMRSQASPYNLDDLWTNGSADAEDWANPGKNSKTKY